MPTVGTLQDVCWSKAAVLTELISRLARCTLQEDIARYAGQMVAELRCILVRCQLNEPAPGAAPANYHESG